MARFRFCPITWGFLSHELANGKSTERGAENSADAVVAGITPQIRVRFVNYNESEDGTIRFWSQWPFIDKLGLKFTTMRNGMPEKRMTQPIRIQRKRIKGFDLQAESLSRNGLPCIYVGRPGRWGNPFRIDFSADEFYKQQCVDAYRALLTHDFKWFKRSGFMPYTAGAALSYSFKTKEDVARYLEPLRGKNLACWCKESALCHADILLELANV